MAMRGRNVVLNGTALGIVVAVCVFLGACGCGDFSQEDLLFLAALPAKETIEVRPAGTRSAVNNTSTGQALQRACDDGDLRCTAENIATGFNGLTFALLDAVDSVTALPPSTREVGRRVWGPHYDASKNETFRFEMVRSADGGTFAFCLHHKRGTVRFGSADEVTCADRDHAASGLVSLLEGQLTPGDLQGARAKTGVGSMTLFTQRLPDLAGFGSRLVIDFDNRDSGTTVDIAFFDVPVQGTGLLRDAAYHYQRSADGAGKFAFEIDLNIIALLPDAGPEHAKIYAAWLDDQSGRADASITEGDTPQGSDVQSHQCWGADLADAYRAPFGEVATGDEGLCVIAATTITP